MGVCVSVAGASCRCETLACEDQKNKSSFMLLGAGADFSWDDEALPASHWSRPAVVAVIYLIACGLHNQRLRMKQTAGVPTKGASPLLFLASVTHNANLVVFSSVTFFLAGYHFLDLVSSTGLRTFLCPPVPTMRIGNPSLPPPPLSGKLQFWSYIFYLSKYYELLDTVLLMLHGKRIILLHAFHHAFIPLVMVVLFQGRVAVSLTGLTVLNSLVHVVMYSYFLAVALGRHPSAAWKQQVTRLQILQFSAGVVGGTWYYWLYFRDVSLTWRGLKYVEGCAGGAPSTVLVGYLMNCTLLGLFLRFYRDAYLRGSRPPVRSARRPAKTRGKRVPSRSPSRASKSDAPPSPSKQNVAPAVTHRRPRGRTP